MRDDEIPHSQTFKHWCGGTFTIAPINPDGGGELSWIIHSMPECREFRKFIMTEVST